MRFWADPRSLVATYGISVDFFSSGYLDISVPRVRSVHLCIQCTVPLARWVSPFGHCRIKACCQLPDTFRRLPRPSSPLTAKASTVCAYSLDHITSSRLEAGASLPCYNDTCFKMAARSSPDSSQTLLRHKLSKNRKPTSTSASLIFSYALSFRVGGSGRTRTTDLALIRGAL